MCWNACVHRLDLVLYSHPKEFEGNVIQGAKHTLDTERQSKTGSSTADNNNNNNNKKKKKKKKKNDDDDERISTAPFHVKHAQLR